jgi:Clostripain family/Bacterial pre-peptidase C-terminal domain
LFTLWDAKAMINTSNQLEKFGQTGNAPYSKGVGGMSQTTGTGISGIGDLFDNNGNMSRATNLNVLTGTRVISDSIGQMEVRPLGTLNTPKYRDTQDFYRFSLAKTSNFSLSLSGLSADADVEIIRDFNLNKSINDGEVIASSSASGIVPESISILGLEAGDYFVRVTPFGDAATNYTLSLTATPKVTAAWTVMVYLDADNDLEAAGIDDFLEMASIGSTSDINVVVQFDRASGYDTRFDDWTDTRRGLVRFGDSPTQFWGTGLGEVAMDRQNSLNSFVNWGMSNYQANNYALIIWNHGGGYTGIASDASSGNSNNCLELKEVSGALSNLPDTIDILGADACLMGMTEFAYQIRNNASILVASEELIPGTGWNYNTILSDLTANPWMGANQLSNTIVQRYEQQYRVDGSAGETLSAINLVELRNSNNLASALSNFANFFMSSSTAHDRNQLEVHRSNAAEFDYVYRVHPHYRDLGTILAGVVGDTSMTTRIRAAAQIALNAYNATVMDNFSETAGKGTGLSINFQQRRTALDTYYTGANLSFSADTRWDEFLTWWQFA